jgi:hypothetical protein
MATTMAAVTPVAIRFAAAETADKMIDLLATDVDGTSARTGGAEPPADTSTSVSIPMVDNTQRLFELEHAKLVAGVAGEAAAILVSFDRFTRRVIGVDGMSVLRAWMPPVANEMERLQVLEHEPNPECMELWGKVWARWWNMLVAGRDADQR